MFIGSSVFAESLVFFTIGVVTSFLFYQMMILFNFWILSYVIGNAFNVLGASDKIVQIMQ